MVEGGHEDLAKMNWDGREALVGHSMRKVPGGPKNLLEEGGALVNVLKW